MNRVPILEGKNGAPIIAISSSGFLSVIGIHSG